jgi:hypothetical protein
MGRRGQTGRRTFLGAAFSGLLLVLGGCGGSGQLSHSQLVARADSYCHQATARVAALTAPSNLSTLSAYADQTRAETVELASRLKTLKASSSDKRVLDNYIAALAKGNELLSRIASAAAANESTTVGTLGKELAAVPTAAIASEGGLSQCAQSTVTATAG